VLTIFRGAREGNAGVWGWRTAAGRGGDEDEDPGVRDRRKASREFEKRTREVGGASWTWGPAAEAFL
jgi:hypothetical protein